MSDFAFENRSPNLENSLNSIEKSHFSASMLFYQKITSGCGMFVSFVPCWLQKPTNIESLRRLGTSWGRLGAVLKAFGVVLGRLGGVKGSLEGVLGRLGNLLGASWWRFKDWPPKELPQTHEDSNVVPQGRLPFAYALGF